MEQEPTKCPPGYHRALNGECVQDITPPAPNLVEQTSSEDEKSEDAG